MNYLQNILGQMQKQRASGLNPAPRWSSTGDNQGFYDMEFARREADDQFNRDRQMRELDILQGAFQAPQRREFSYQRTQFQPQERMPGGMGGMGRASFGREPIPSIQNYLARLMGGGNSLRSGG